mgnify:CR=1 FL=1
MIQHPSPLSSDKTDLARHNVKAFTDDHLILGIPQGGFMLGIVIVLLSYFVTKILWLPVLVAALYYVPMYHVHRDDPRGLKIWVNVLASSTLVWEAGRRKPFQFTVLSY